jgi:putative membrane protein
MDYGVIKSLHIIFVVTWFAGLFYMFRLFVYHIEALSKPELEQSILIKQYGIMERRLWYIITWPSCILTLIFGSTLLYIKSGLLSQPWMHLKLFFIACLLLYQWKGQMIFKGLKSGSYQSTSLKMRMWNEVGTLLLVAIVFIVVNQNSISWIWGSLGLIGLGAILTLMVKAYKKIREGKSNNNETSNESI